MFKSDKTPVVVTPELQHIATIAQAIRLILSTFPSLSIDEVSRAFGMVINAYAIQLLVDDEPTYRALQAEIHDARKEGAADAATGDLNSTRPN